MTNRYLPTIALWIALAGSSAAAVQSGPTITGLFDATATPSGRFRIEGSGFGSNASFGSVLVSGQPAIVTTWSESRIHAYVPEATAPGPASVVVEVAAVTSNPVLLDVVPRSSQGRVRWRFQLDSWAATHHRPGVGPDGSIYIDEGLGKLYAVSPDGALQWVYDTDGPVDGGAADGSVVVGGDGTIYMASNPLGPDAQIHALNPDGSVRWIYTTTDTQGVIAGPSIGPDGNIYAVTDNAGSILGGLGAFSLDPQGNLRWSNAGSPEINEHGQLGQEISFGPEHMYVAFDEYGVAFNTFFGFRLSNGNQEFALTGPSDPAETAVGASTNVYVRWGGGAGGIASFSATGDSLWLAMRPSPNNTLTNPVVGPDEVIYASHNLAHLWAIDSADGSTRWYEQDDDVGILSNIGVRADNGLILTGGGPTFGVPGWIKAFAPADGSELWRVDLPTEPNGGRVSVNGRPFFDGDVAYLSGIVLGGNVSNQYSYLYAIDTGDGVADADSFCFGDGSGTACPCGNFAGGPGGCLNEAGQSAVLTRSGQSSLGADSLRFELSGGTPASFAVLLSAANRLPAAQPGAGIPAFDGLRCIGGNLLRHGVRALDPTGAAGATGPGWGAPDGPAAGLLAQGGFSAGQVRHFQAFYRTDALLGCGGGQNTSNGVTVTVEP